jgi:uncharacterized protein (TIGR03437 family)
MRWVLVLVALGTVRLSAQQCGTGGISGIQPSPAYFDGTHGSSTIPASGGSFPVSVDTGNSSNCSWTVSTSASWITPSTQGGNGSGSFNLVVATNTTNTSRSATLVMTDEWTIPITQQAAVCTLALPSTSAGAVVGGGAASFTLQTNCSWNAYSNNAWITVAAQTNGTGNGSVPYTVAANGCVAGRSGSITVGAGSLSPAQTNNPSGNFTINQDGSPNNLGLSPTTATVSAAGGQGSVALTTGSGCPWTAYVDQTWLQIVFGGSGSGSGTISYNIPVNTGPARTANIHVGAQTFTLTQAGAAAPVPQLTAVVNAASYAVGPIAPGEVVALGGTALGPAQPVGAQLASNGQSITTTLGGVQVMFDGKYPAALTYVSDRQLNAIAPYEIAGEDSTQIIVQYGGATSAAFTAQVEAAAPGIFSLDFNGLGNGAILDQDYSVNGNLHPATRGSWVMIYCTGGGVTVPASTDAALTPAANTLAFYPAQVTVTIGGIASPSVAYAGGAPGAVAGLVQINAQVPPNVTPGSNVPVVVQIGSWQSQAGVTMVVQ